VQGLNPDQVARPTRLPPLAGYMLIHSFIRKSANPKKEQKLKTYLAEKRDRFRTEEAKHFLVECDGAPRESDDTDLATKHVSNANDNNSLLLIRPRRQEHAIAALMLNMFFDRQAVLMNK
jgi:hypothetical protein